MNCRSYYVLYLFMIVFSLACGVEFLLHEYDDGPGLRIKVLCKPAPVLMMLLFAFHIRQTESISCKWYFAFISLGLLLSAAADMLLALGMFTEGLFVFLLLRCCYITAISSRSDPPEHSNRTRSMRGRSTLIVSTSVSSLELGLLSKESKEGSTTSIRMREPSRRSIMSYRRDPVVPRVDLHVLRGIPWAIIMGALVAYLYAQVKQDGLLMPIIAYCTVSCALAWRAFARVGYLTLPPRKQLRLLCVTLCFGRQRQPCCSRKKLAPSPSLGSLPTIMEEEFAVKVPEALWRQVLALVGVLVLESSQVLFAFQRWRFPDAGYYLSIPTMAVYWLGNLWITMSIPVTHKGDASAFNEFMRMYNEIVFADDDSVSDILMP